MFGALSDVREEQRQGVFVSCLRIGKQCLLHDDRQTQNGAEGPSPYLHLQRCRRCEAVVPALMKQYRKQHWIKFSCELWPPTRGKEGSFEEEDSWVLVSRP